MLVRSPRWLPLALVLVACGDSGGGATAGALTTVTSGSTTAPHTTTTTSDSTSAPGTTHSSGEPTTSVGAGTAATTDDTTTTGTTGAPDTTTTADATATTAGETTEPASGTSTTSTTGGPVCGDGVVEAGETCDDGSGVGCDSYHDGGDGVCLPPGTCSSGYVPSGDGCVPELWTEHVHIYVSNTCEMMVDPPAFQVQPGQKLRLDYHNHSADYPVDVWMHYNGGYTDLPPGATWMEKYEHCFGPNPSQGWAEISTACSQVTLPITCL